MSDPYVQLRAIDAEQLIPSGRPQTLVSLTLCRLPGPNYVDRRSGMPWPSGGSLPFIVNPMFAGFAVA